ncbi:MAG: c-type cytochrome [Chloroflexi bacterium]|nr:c-type cytochrome [Chloroflexota bacterium]
MFVNILIFLVILAVTLGGGWLTWKALRAKRLWVKIAGGLLAGLLTLVLAAVSFIGGKGIAALYFPGAPAAPEMSIAGAPEQIARGEYLVNISCIGCHSAVDASGNPSGEQPLSGGWNIAAAEGFGFVGSIVTENLTPGGKLAEYSDGELFRALRYGVNRDGRLLGFMSLLPYGRLSDEDTQAIIAYLRSQPPVQNEAASGDQFSYVGVLLFGSGMFGEPAPAAEHVFAPPAAVNAEYGKYVATFGECLGCHGPDATGVEASAVVPAVPNPRPFVGALTQEQFFEMMRTGVRPGGAAFSEAMPWENASKMTDDDLAALYAYLTAPVN